MIRRTSARPRPTRPSNIASPAVRDTPIPNTYAVVHEELLWFQDVVLDEQEYACFWSSIVGHPMTLPKNSTGGYEFKMEHRVPLTLDGEEAVNTLIVSCAWH